MPDARVRRGLRVAFYALLIAVPLSGWWLASEEGMPAHLLGMPALPQWYHQGGAPHLGSTHSEASRENAVQKDPVVPDLSRLHASLSAALAVVIALHLISLFKYREADAAG